MGRKGLLQPFLSCAFVGNIPVVGTRDGRLYVFKDRVLDAALPAHDGAVTVLESCSEGLVSGGRDGMVKLWTTTLDLRAEFNIAAENILSPPCVDPRIRSVCWDHVRGRILVCTRGGEVLELNDQDGTNLHTGLSGASNVGKALLEGHCDGQVWGLACCPHADEITTVGDDRTIRIWSLINRRILRRTELPNLSRAVHYHPDGRMLALGLGVFSVLSTRTTNDLIEFDFIRLIKKKKILNYSIYSIRLCYKICFHNDNKLKYRMKMNIQYIIFQIFNLI